MKESAKRTLWKQAKATVMAARGKNEFRSWEEEKARYAAMVEMVTALKILTQEEIEEIQERAKRA